MTAEEILSLERKVGETAVERSKVERQKRELMLSIDRLNEIIKNEGISKEENEAIEKENQRNLERNKVLEQNISVL